MTRQKVLDPQKEVLTPEPDGVSTDFTFTTAYKAGTVSIWRNGKKLFPEYDDGFLEMGGSTIRMKIPPLSGDTLMGEYDLP